MLFFTTILFATQQPLNPVPEELAQYWLPRDPKLEEVLSGDDKYIFQEKERQNIKNIIKEVEDTLRNLMQNDIYSNELDNLYKQIDALDPNPRNPRRESIAATAKIIDAKIESTLDKQEKDREKMEHYRDALKILKDSLSTYP